MPNTASGRGAARGKLKTIEELSKTYKEIPTVEEITKAQARLFNLGDAKEMEKVLKRIKEIVKVDKDRLKILKAIEESSKTFIGFNKQNEEQQKESLKKLNIINEAVKEIREEEEKTNEVYRKRRELYREIEAGLAKMSQKSKEIFTTAQEMQVHSNLTWRQYTEAYDKAYDAARRMNREIGQSLHQARDIIEMQDKLLRDGWRNIDMATMTEVAASIRMASTALGIDFPEALSRAFQSSFKQFGDQTASFIDSMTNRLNAFQGEFGVHIGMLTGVVQDMATSTSFIARNNMQAQIQANESLIRAAALAGRVGLDTSTFISELGQTSMWGTPQEMSTIYQGGALIGLDVDRFQQQMIGGQSSEAIESLFGSIYQTMQGLEGDHYLRNLYMQEISGAFGLTRDDILNIMTYGGEINEYTAELQEQLLGVETSIEEELSGLRLDVTTKLANWWDNTQMVQSYNKVMQDLGLHGLYGEVKQIKGLLTIITSRQALGGTNNTLRSWLGSTPNLQGTGGVGQTGPQIMLGGYGGNLSRGARLGIGGLGLMASNTAGNYVQQNQNLSTGTANTLGAITHIGGGAASGALMGSAIAPGIGTAIGAIAGGLWGAYNADKAAGERESARVKLEDDRRRRAQQTGATQTGDPLLDAINRQTNVLESAITGASDATVRATVISDMYKKTTTKGTIID